MKTKHLLLITAIFIATSCAWWVLGLTLGYRTQVIGSRSHGAVHSLWGPELRQQHPSASFRDATGPVELLPASSTVHVDLDYQPRQRGFIWHRTYSVDFAADYVFENPTQVTQSLALSLPLPGDNVRLEHFAFTVAEAGTEKPIATQQAPQDGLMRTTIEVGPGKSVTLHAAYRTRGMNSWHYGFPANVRIQNFQLDLHTNFDDIDFPLDTGSPTEDLIEVEDGRWRTGWNFPDVIALSGIGMVMPATVDAGPIATQVALWAPLSLALFFAVLVIAGIVKQVPLHPMNYVLLAGGFFAFPLLFAYLVDIASVHGAFAIAAAASLLLVCGYLRLVAGGALFWIALPTQFFYLILFSYSFFITGYTGLTLTLGGVITLGALMALTARVDWSSIQVPTLWKKKPHPSAEPIAV